ncbi:hypothetical protein [Streptomyces sp. RKAG337]|uniref:hypothetical protein n=1 Tax=Streptomyces sp. RKAG337 TaxID=2893404 RepID=UPI0020339F78|nr:hypothetical protein [Streptomyces sp. RKAG337]MCM2427050.1 hypothetical protein [Streptomyces sp. RKAG337]
MFALITAIAQHLAQTEFGTAGAVAVPLFLFGWKTRNTAAMLAALAVVAMSLSQR